MTEVATSSPARAGQLAVALLFGYVCLLPMSWSALPFNMQWTDVLFPALLICTITTRPAYRFLRVDIIVLVYFVSSLVSLLGTTELGASVVQMTKQGYLALLYGVVALLGGQLIPPARLARWLAATATMVATICILAVAIYFVTGVALPGLGAVMPLPYVGQFYRLYGAFPSPEYLVNFLAFCTPLAIVQALRSNCPGSRRLWVSALVAILVAAIFTAGHGILGLMAAATLMLAWSWRRRRPVLVAGAVTATVVLIVVVNVLLIVAVRDMRIVTSRDMTVGQPAYPYVFHDDQAGAPKVRVELTYNFMTYWLLKQLAWDTFLQEPVRGIGLGSFHNETRRAASEGRIPPGYREHDPHSTWLGRLAETGIIGTMALAALWIGMMHRAYQLAAAGGPRADIMVAFAASLLAVFVNSPNVDVMNFRFLWLAFGALAGASDRA